MRVVHRALARLRRRTSLVGHLALVKEDFVLLAIGLRRDAPAVRLVVAPLAAVALQAAAQLLVGLLGPHHSALAVLLRVEELAFVHAAVRVLEAAEALLGSVVEFAGVRAVVILVHTAPVDGVVLKLACECEKKGFLLDWMVF